MKKMRSICVSFMGQSKAVYDEKIKEILNEIADELIKGYYKIKVLLKNGDEFCRVAEDVFEDKKGCNAEIKLEYYNDTNEMITESSFLVCYADETAFEMREIIEYEEAQGGKIMNVFEMLS